MAQTYKFLLIVRYFGSSS